MRLIVFDIDGTLTSTSRVDEACFARAYERIFKRPITSTNWHAYPHVSDTGILRELAAEVGSGRLNDRELARFETSYRSELAAAFLREPSAFREVPGARAALRMIEEHRDWRVALATGGLRGPALFKLDRIGVNGRSLPAAFANDAIARSDITRCAICRAGIVTEDIVYVGDALWDLRTAAELSIRFVAITHESDASGFRTADAIPLLRDYRDLAAFRDALDRAAVPSAMESVAKPSP